MSFGVRVYKQYFNFASSHFLIFSDGAREELHGHNYQVRVRLWGAIGPDDMVLDFCRVKPVVKRLCDELDHKTLLPAQNPRLEVGPAPAELGEGHLLASYARPDGGQDRFVFPARDVELLPLANTSTERLAELLTGRILVALEEGGEDVGRLSRIELEVEESGGQCGVYGRDL